MDIKENAHNSSTDDDARFAPPGSPEREQAEAGAEQEAAPLAEAEADTPAAPTSGESVGSQTRQELTAQAQALKKTLREAIVLRAADLDPETDPDFETEDPDIVVSTEERRVVDALSTALSWILVPLLMPVYGIMLIFGLSILDYTPADTKLSFTLIVFALNVVLPMIFILLLKLFGVVGDVGLNRRRERFIPYTIVALCMAGTAWFMASRGAPMWVAMFYAGGATAAVVNTVINIWWKISAHSAGMAGIVALLIRIAHDGVPQSDVLVWLIVTILLTGLLGSSRLWLRRHTLAQVLGGYTTGFLGVFLMTMIP